MNNEELLTALRLVPIKSSTSRWQSFLLQHEKPANDLTKRNVKKFLHDQLNNTAGLYVYVNENEDVLFIGTGRPIKNRLLNHFIECFQPIGIAMEQVKRHHFFSQHQGALTVYWVALNNEKECEEIQAILIDVLQPLYTQLEIDVYKPEQLAINNEEPMKPYVLIEQDIFIQQTIELLGPNFTAVEVKNSMTFYREGHRILKVNCGKAEYTIAFYVPITMQDGVQLVVNEANETLYVYIGNDMNIAYDLVAEAKKNQQAIYF